MTKESVYLEYVGNGHNKFYSISIEEQDGGFVVPFTYGRNGTVGKDGNKVDEPVPFEKAKKVFDRVVKSKKEKGYVES